MNASSIAVLDCLRAHPGATYAQLVAITGRTLTVVQHVVSRAREHGIVDTDHARDGSRNVAYHWLVAEPERAKIDRVLDAISAARGGITFGALRLRLPDIRPGTIYEHISALEQRGAIEVLSESRPFRFRRRLETT